MALEETRLNRSCFGKSESDNFGQDVRVPCKYLESEAYHLNYSRRPGKTGYYIPERPDLALELADRIPALMTEVDRKQLAIFRRLSPARRLRQAGCLPDHLRRIATNRIHRERPDLFFPEAHREVLHLTGDTASEPLDLLTFARMMIDALDAVNL